MALEGNTEKRRSAIVTGSDSGIGKATAVALAEARLRRLLRRQGRSRTADQVMALELAEHGITVNSVAPGEIATAMTGNEDVDPRAVEWRPRRTISPAVARAFRHSRLG